MNALENTYIKLNNIYYSIICSEIIHNIYWTLIIFTNNIKLGMFLSDRGILLFQEYIYIYNNNNKISSHIKLEDVKQFIYKKTIGPLKINNKKIYSQNMKKIYSISNYIKELYHCIFKIYKTNIDDDKYQKDIKYVFNILEPILFDIDLDTIYLLYSHLPFSYIHKNNLIFYINVVYISLKENKIINQKHLQWIDDKFTNESGFLEHNNYLNDYLDKNTMDNNIQMNKSME